MVRRKVLRFRYEVRSNCLEAQTEDSCLRHQQSHSSPFLEILSFHVLDTWLPSYIILDACIVERSFENTPLLRTLLQSPALRASH